MLSHSARLLKWAVERQGELSTSVHLRRMAFAVMLGRSNPQEVAKIQSPVPGYRVQYQDCQFNPPRLFLASWRTQGADVADAGLVRICTLTYNQRFDASQSFKEWIGRGCPEDPDLG